MLIELLLGLGVVGAGVAMASILLVGFRALSAKHASDRLLGAAEAAVFVHLFAVGFVEAAPVIPGFAFVMLVVIFLAVSNPNKVDRMEGAYRDLPSSGERVRAVAIHPDRDRRTLPTLGSPDSSRGKAGDVGLPFNHSSGRSARHRR